MIMQQPTQIYQFLDFLVDAILIVDQNSNILFANQSCNQLFGYELEGMENLSLEKLLPATHSEMHKEKVKHFIEHQSPARTMMSRNMLSCIKSNGDSFAARISIASITLNGERCGIATIHDFSTIQEFVEDLRSKVITDPLTNLFNRRHLNILLEKQSQAIFNSNCMGIAYLDLNKFKAINDSFGHVTGDLLLKEVSRRLTESLRSDDICFRLGGDEFLVLFNLTKHYDRTSEAKSMANKLNQLISTPVYVSTLGHEITIRASIGIGIYPDDSSSLSTLIELADKAMYRAKIASEPYMCVSEKRTAPTVL